MRYKWLILPLLILLGVGVSAQDCGNGLPCGPLPWDLPAYPVLNSPTPLNREVDGSALLSTVTPTPSPTPTNTPTPTYTPSPTITPYFEETAINAQLATLQAAQGTPQIVANAQGTEIALIDVQAQVGEAALFIGYVKGLNSNMFGPFAPLMVVMLFAVSVGVFMTLMKVIIPILVFMAGLVRKVVSFILEFIPL